MLFRSLEENTVPVQETIKQYRGNVAPPSSDDEMISNTLADQESGPKFQQYSLPGGENYREVLLHLPGGEETRRARLNALTDQSNALLNGRSVSQLTPEERAKWDELERRHNTVADRDDEYKSSHWDEPNVLAHIRMSDRKGPNGEKVLHVEEIQSDWGQEGRERGFNPEKKEPPKLTVSRLGNGRWEVYNETHGRTAVDEDGFEAIYPTEREAHAMREQLLRDPYEMASGVPSGPYVDNTQKWTDLALKRVLHEAAHGGYDKVVFTPGSEQNKRYSLSNQVDELHYDPDAKELIFRPVNQASYHTKDVEPDELARHVGKELAKKLLETPRKNTNLARNPVHSLEGDNLEVGGSGMKGYYDNIMPKRLQALAQQHDPKARVQLGGHKLNDPDFENERDDLAAQFREANQRPPVHDDELRQWALAEHGDDPETRAMLTGATPLHSLDVTPQMRDSIKANGFNQFKRGGDVGMRQRYADGGGANDNPVVNKALDLVSMFQPAQPTSSAPAPSLTGQTVPHGTVSIKSLSDAFDAAIAHHTSLPPEQRAANSRAAAEKLTAHMGRTKSGMPPPLLTKNAKLTKAEAGYKGGKPLTLPDGRGVETTGLALAPAYQEGKFTTCPNSASCKAECLGKTSGNYFKLGGGKDLDAAQGPRLNSFNKTQAMLREPEAFAVRLHDEIEAAKRIAEMNNNMLGVRLNVLSDINPRVHKAIINAHPDVAFYDYTKNNSNPVAPNHHYTYSSTGVSDTDVDNPHSNWKQMRKRLDTGSNVAMAFSDREHLPQVVHDEETGKHYKVVDGDTHDFRPLDKVGEGEDGVIVGLKNKKAKGKQMEAHKDSKGFFVKYDPELIRNEKGTYLRGESPGISEKTGKPKLGPTIPGNKQVVIGRQTKLSKKGEEN